MEEKIIKLMEHIEKLKKEKNDETIAKETALSELSKIELQYEKPHNKPQQMKIPSHLKPVRPEHLPHLKGLRMKLPVASDGARLTYCATAHISGTDSKGERN